jgi:starch synthase
MVAAEAYPFATSGGLSEVVGSLAGALGRLGHVVTLVLPRYGKAASRPASSSDTPTPNEPDPGPDDRTVIELGDRLQSVAFIRQPISEGVTAVFVDAPDLFDRGGLYGTGDGDYPDNAFRFAVLSRAALEYLRLRGERPSVIHAHDWHAGLVPAYQKMLFSDDPVVGRVPVVFTIHNLAFQGNFPVSTLSEIGLPPEVLHVHAMEFWGRISYLKSGINFSERITTVSPGYAREVVSPDRGFGFDGVLTRRSDDFTGILNGIDTSRWNPASDAFLPAPYSANELSGKIESKRFLLEAMGLPASGDALRRPLVGLVSRLTDQKGFDLIAEAADELMGLDAAWVMLGSGERRYEEFWTALATRHPERVAVTIGYDERLEHLIEAGADAFLMPSRFEPCGLNQLNSLRYGAVPIVRATGGLDDTVEDADPSTGGGTGFKFTDYTPEALLGAVRRALEAYRNPKLWQQIQRNAMQQDYSWDVSAREYVKVYSATS